MLLLGGAELAGAQTYPSDVVGKPAAQCATLDALGVPQLCGPANPLATSGASAATGAAAGALSGGQLWFLTQPPGFNPFVRSDGSASNAVPYCSFLDDINVVCFQSGTVIQVQSYRSNDAGKSFTAVAQSTTFPFSLEGVLPLPTGGYLFISGQFTSSPFYTSGDGITFTGRTATGFPLGNPVGRPVGPNVNTILAPVSSSAVLCRSTNLGTSWACAGIATPSGYSGGVVTWMGSSGGGNSDGPQTFAVVSPNVWLALIQDGNTNNLVIIRSTDDGATWTLVFRSSDASGAGQAGVTCISSTVCLMATGQSIYRSSNAGQTWTQVVSTGPNGANTAWVGVVPISSTVAVVVPHASNSTNGFYRTVDGGLTWLGEPGGTSCPRNNGVPRGLGSLAVRNGRAIVISRYTALLSGGPCAHYAPLGTGSTAVAGPLGVPWGIDERGFGPVFQPDKLNPFASAPVQGINLLNSQTVSAVNTAVVITIPAVTDQRAHVYDIEAVCSAGTASVTITDGGTTIWGTLAAEVGTAKFRKPWNTGLPSSTNSALVITLSTCGAANTGTLTVQADRF